MSPLQIVALGLGVLAVYSAIRDINPLQLVKDTLQGKKAPEAGSWSPTTAQSVVYTTPSVGITPPGSFSGAMIWPTKARRISARYKETGPRWETYHTGIDIDGACGDAIWSPVSGTIAYAGYNGPYGLQVKINVGGTKGTQVWLNHFAGIGAKIRPGQVVAPGDHVGSMGTTGNSSGCHLHFEVRVNGKDVDPNQYFGVSV